MKGDVLRNCIVCGSEPFVHRSSVTAAGCNFIATIVECTYEENNQEQMLPAFIEHSLAVYGENEDVAVKRWNELNAKKN